MKSDPVSEEVPLEKESEADTKLSHFLNYFTEHLENRPTIESLKSEFSDRKMRDENQQFKPCYANIVLLQSRLEYENFPITELKVPFVGPRE